MHIIGSQEYYRARAVAFRIIHALDESIQDCDFAKDACNFAYCDTAYEMFDGDYDEFVASRGRAFHRARRRRDLLAYIAGRNGYVVETLRAQDRTDLLWWLHDLPLLAAA